MVELYKGWCNDGFKGRCNDGWIYVNVDTLMDLCKG